MTTETRPLHSPLGASSAERWIPCPGSVRLAAKYPQKSSPEAQEGTAAHHLCAVCLEAGTDAWEYAGQQIGVTEHHAWLWAGEGEPSVEMVGGAEYSLFDVTDEMVEAVQLYLDTVRNEPGTLLIEHGFHLKYLHPMFYGTADAVVLDGTKLSVFDFKYGIGIVKEAVENPQLQYYAAGAVEAFDEAFIETIELVIVQPRAAHSEGPVRRWTTTLDSLGEWAMGVLLPAARRTEAPDAPLAPGDWCRFCPASGNCPAQKELAEGMPDIGEPADGIEAWEIAELLDKCAAIRIFQRALEKIAFSRMMDGEEVPGFKLVQKRSDRVWKDGAEGQLEKTFGDEAFEKRLRTPPQIEKMKGGKSIVTQLAYKPDTGLTIAPAGDTRAAVNPRSAADAFADVPTEEF